MIYFVFWISLCIDSHTAFLQTDKEKIAAEGMSTTVTCLYDVRVYKFYKKYWCRGSSRASCEVLGDTQKFFKWNYRSRLSLIDNRRGVLLVTMHQLVEDDSGTYWCGIDRPHADIMIAMKLKVNKGPEIRDYIRTTPSSVASPTRLPTPYSISSYTTEIATSFPDNSTFHLNASHLSSSTDHHVTEQNWNYSPWGILRWVILVILVTSLTVIHWNWM